MNRILILGARGQLAKHTVPVLLTHADVENTLYLRRAKRLTNPYPARVTIIEGGVLSSTTLEFAC